MFVYADVDSEDERFGVERAFQGSDGRGDGGDGVC